MACFWLHQQETTITVPTVEEVDGVTFYKICVAVDNVSWYVSHRYNDFYELHNTLVNDNGVSKDLLPPKKLLGNKDPAFVESRRQGLEKYLQEILCFLKRIMPKTFTDFIHFQKYEICCLLQALAFRICNETQAVLESNTYSFNPVELYAITEILKNPHPGFERTDNKYDIGHVFDFCSKLNEVSIKGNPEKYLESDIVTNSLPFDFIAFKAIKLLKVTRLNMENVSSAENARKLVKKLSVNNSSLTTVSQILQCDVLHKSSIDSSQIWSTITHLDLSGNNIIKIDESINLVPLLKKLNLSDNKLTSLYGLSALENLTHINVSKNKLLLCEDVKFKLPNIVEIDISQNMVYSLRGFEDMQHLETLDISFNQISDIKEAGFISKIALKNLILTGNPVATTVDYRLKILEYFGKNSSKIWLDNERTSQAEVDKVQLLCALRIVKEGKIPNLTSPVSYKC